MTPVHQVSARHRQGADGGAGASVEDEKEVVSSDLLKTL